jgi:hypothetical protein
LSKEDWVMKHKIRFTFLSFALTALLLIGMMGSVPIGHAEGPIPNPPDTPLDTAFTYQGFLVYQGSYYDGVCDFRFGLFNVETGGTPIAPFIAVTGVRVRNGYFTVKLDFGADVINGTKRWLQIAVHCPSPANPNQLQILRPRQELTPVPHALALPGLWTQPGTSPNLIGGYYGNLVNDGARGATIGGGGHATLIDSAIPWPYPPLEAADQVRAYRAINSVTRPYGTVGGGLGNRADLVAVVSGGAYNEADGPGAAIGGGGINSATGLGATVAGGYKNQASGTFAAIGGGEHNTAAYTDTTVSGGAYNKAGRYGATIGGGTVNLASGHGATVAGGGINTASADGATIAGGGYNIANNRGTTVGGGEHNRAGSALTPVDPARLDAFRFDIFPLEPTLENPDPFDPAPVDPELRGIYATVSGGAYNAASGPGTTIGGGGVNTANGLAATVAGGVLNKANGDYSAAGGGVRNMASGLGATIGGGMSNSTGSNASDTTANTRGHYATVPGGFQNSARGNYSFAAGQRAKSNHLGAFVWADASNADLASAGPNQFIVRASGGIWLGGTHSISPTIPPDRFLNTSTGAYLSNAGTWTNASDRRAKENFALVDGREVLADLAEVSISTWNYRADAPSTRHMGPVAQDFYAAFGLGNDDISIATVDADGVALAAIQGLYQLVQEQGAQIATLQEQNRDLEARVAVLEALAASLTEAPAGGR